MTAESNLPKLLQGMQAVLTEGTHVFVTVAETDIPAQLTPLMTFREAEGVTLILLCDEAAAQGLAYEFPCRMITLNVHSALDAVGFLARITSELAKEGISVNPVAGFHHDHLFVPESRAEDAMRVLRKIAEDPA